MCLYLYKYDYYFLSLGFFTMLMQVIHAEIKQSDENVVARLTVDRMLNRDRELE